MRRIEYTRGRRLVAHTPAQRRLADALRRVDNRLYHVRTHAHATLSRYVQWTDGNRRPPEEMAISPHTGHVWYALAGCLEWSHEYDSGRMAAFSALEDARAEWIGRVLGDAGPGFKGTRAGKRVQLRLLETDRRFEWIGEPVPGVEHKWADARGGYERLRYSVATGEGGEHTGGR